MGGLEGDYKISFEGWLVIIYLERDGDRKALNICDPCHWHIVDGAIEKTKASA